MCRFRLSALLDGSTKPSCLVMMLEQMVDAESHVKREAAKKAAAKKGFGASPADAPSVLDPDSSPSCSEDEQLEAVARLNSFGGMHGDLAASHYRGEPLSSFLGIWPEVALINHRWEQ